MAESRHTKSPWIVRWLAWLFTALFGVLCYWLLGFVVNDLGSLRDSDYLAFETERLPAARVEESRRLTSELAATQREMNATESRQRLLRDSTSSSQQTMNQLLEFQRLSLSKNVKPSEPEQAALADAERRFLANQADYQKLNTELAQLNEQQVRLENERLAVEQELNTLREPIQVEWQALVERQNWQIGLLKLAVLVPLVLVGALLSWKLRGGAYARMAYAFVVAAAIKSYVVMHDFFPAQFFKYVLIGTLLLIVARVLQRLLQVMAHPPADSLRKAYREGYESLTCPVCDYPMRRGPWKFLAWTGRTVWKLAAKVDPAGAADEPYTCPSCATQLYEKCQQCSAIRPSLLPACPGCGHERGA